MGSTFGRPWFGHTTKINLKIQTVAPEICLILIFHKRFCSGFSTPFCILCMIFQEKYFSCYTLLTINWPSFIVLLSLPLEILANMFIVIICYRVCVVINFEISYSFQKIRTKIQIYQERRKLSTWNKKHFHNYFIIKGLSLKK